MATNHAQYVSFSKWKQLQEEKISLERMHEEEEEARVNRLARELAVLRVRQHQAQHSQASQATTAEDSSLVGPSSGSGITATFVHNGASGSSSSVLANGIDTPDPSTDVLVNALKKENENLRSRLGTVECEYVRLTRLNEIYREELIQHRRRVSHLLICWG